MLAAVGDDVRPYVAADRRALASSVRPAQAANRDTRRPLRSDTLPAWTIVDPLPPDELLGYYREAEAATGVAVVLAGGHPPAGDPMGRIRRHLVGGRRRPDAVPPDHMGGMLHAATR